MSREIKFRGKRIDNGKWVYGGFHKHQKTTPCPIIPNGEKVQETEHAYLIIESGFSDWNLPKPLWAHEVEPETIGQFTGLYDKNGEEIYEGDIVTQDDYIWFDKGIPNYRGTVEWIYSQWQVVAHCVNPNKRGVSNGINQGLNDNGLEDGSNSNWEAIGNIYENPELLEVSESCQGDI